MITDESALPQLLSDPHRTCRPYDLQHILGNVGRAGIILLVPPMDPMVREVDVGSWRVANYEPFDGAAQNSFSSTSLHLSFTEGCTPVHDGVSRWGRQDSQVFLLESVVSVFDGGEWVADLDVIGTLQNPMVRRVPTSSAVGMDCRHRDGGAVVKPAREYTSLDSWNEVLDLPREPVVIRANGNWSARLALLAVLVHRLRVDRRYKTGGNSRAAGGAGEAGCQNVPLKTYITICPREVCWACEWGKKLVMEGLGDHFYPHVLLY